MEYLFIALNVFTGFVLFTGTIEEALAKAELAEKFPYIKEFRFKPRRVWYAVGIFLSAIFFFQALYFIALLKSSF